MRISFEGKAVFVTGAASGLGKSTALLFAEHGADLSLLDVNEDGLAEVRSEIEAMGRRCMTQAVDVSAKANCDAAIAATVERYGRLDALCNVAGIVGLCSAGDVSEAYWNRTLAVNLSGPFYLCQAAIPHLLQTRGNIVNVASSGGLKAQAYLVPYSTSKAGLIHMTRCMAMEFMHQPIRINAVAPGAMDTDMGRHTELPEGIDMSLVQRFCNMRAPSQPDDVARLILYVASDLSPSLHGACLSVDTGISIG
ncbi:SDR family oxidoreductase [Paraburkholderia phymatum]|uniref:SDR family NAD(P)-dependent oxidoreductase n=1 Tax=Paraburkholderia phymatum TaxID=148447 RepID=UPI003177755F